MYKIVYWNDDETTLFAVEEFRRLLRNVDIDSKIQTNNSDWAQKTEKTIHLLKTEQYNKLKKSGKEIVIKDDGFAVVRDESIWIIGNEPRALLYGVYEYCRDAFGYQWTEPGRETIQSDNVISRPKEYIHEPVFKRRGNVLETINDPAYINALVDWGIKNGQNEYFFTFFLWDEVKPYISAELKKRGAQVTLGGHSLSYLLKEIQTNATAEELAQDEKLRFFAENDQLQDKIINKIISICQTDQIITRISLWPEDIGIDEKNANDFLPTYIKFTEKLKSALSAAGITIETEHIVYNAGLSWDMLLRDETTVVSDEVDILYAYWGRDYSKSIHDDCPRQKRALESLQDWHQESIKANRSLTIFEYYSDHFMLTELFPPLLTRIREDLKDYQTMNITGILNLIVPLHCKNIYGEIEGSYPWKWIHQMNNYLYSRLSWGIDYDIAINEYFSTFQNDKTTFLEKMYELEAMISQHTKWNAILFPARVVDPEKVADKTKHQEVPEYLAEAYELLETYDLSEVESLLAIQTKDNSASFTVKEMTWIYFYYLRELLKLNEKAWR